jgi:hypothetical protein
MERTVVLDKNSGSRKLKDACNLERDETSVRCVLLPMGIRDTDDDKVVAEFAIQNGYLTLTFDRGFCLEAASVLAGRNPGLLLLSEDHGSNKHMNSKVAQPFLKKFKADFPDWNAVPWSHSLIEITPTFVLVSNTRTALPTLVGVLDRSQPGWQSELRRLLEETAGKGIPG